MCVCVLIGVIRGKCAHQQRTTGSQWVVVEETDQGSGEKITAAQLNQSCGLCPGMDPSSLPVSFPVSVSVCIA